MTDLKDKKTLHDIAVEACRGYRHEIHSEPDLRDEMEDGLIAFADAAL